MEGRQVVGGGCGQPVRDDADLDQDGSHGNRSGWIQDVFWTSPRTLSSFCKDSLSASCTSSLC